MCEDALGHDCLMGEVINPRVRLRRLLPLWGSLEKSGESFGSLSSDYLQTEARQGAIMWSLEPETAVAGLIVRRSLTQCAIGNSMPYAMVGFIFTFCLLLPFLDHISKDES
jgi:hypothetical protein